MAGLFLGKIGSREPLKADLSPLFLFPNFKKMIINYQTQLKKMYLCRVKIKRSIN